MVSRPPTTGETTSSVSILNLIGLRARSLNIGDYIDESGNRHSAPYEKGVFCFFLLQKSDRIQCLNLASLIKLLGLDLDLKLSPKYLNLQN